MSSPNVIDPLRFGDAADQDQLHQDVPIDASPSPPRVPAYTEVSLTDSTPAPERASLEPEPASYASLQRPIYAGSSPQHPLTFGGGGEGQAPQSRTSAASEPSSSATPPPSSAHHSSSLLDSVRLHAAEDFKGPAERACGSQARSGIVRISVGDPQKRSEDSIVPGISSSHYEYLISTAWEAPREPSHTSVRRRFNDFVSLADLLEATHRGYFIFPRPDKNRIDRQLSNEELTRSRVGELERYLRYLADHPTVGASEELATFLTAEGALQAAYDWQRLQPVRGSVLEGVSRLPRQLLGVDAAVPSAAEASQNARNTSDLLRRLRELNERMRQDYGASQAPLEGDEIALRERKASVESYLSKLANTTRKAEKLVQELEDRSIVTGDLGMSLIKLANFEEQEGSKCGQYSDVGLEARAIAADSRRVGAALLRCRRLGRLAVGYVAQALAPLHDELALAPAAVSALRERESALLTTHLLREDIHSKGAAARGLEEAGALRLGGSTAKAKRVAQLQDEVAAAEAALTVADAEYARVKARNIEELERWSAAKARDYKAMAGAFANVCFKYEERSKEILQATVEEADVATSSA